jgi:hypothetical protein
VLSEKSSDIELDWTFSRVVVLEEEAAPTGSFLSAECCQERGVPRPVDDKNLHCALEAVSIS